MSKNIGKTRSKLAEFFFKRYNSKKVEPANDLFKLSSCKSIAFIYDEESSDFKPLLNLFQSYFKNNGKAISYHKMAVDTLNQSMPDDGINAVNFSTEEINLYAKPKSLEVIDFLNKDFDLLINLSSINNWPMRFAIAMSKAKFKVGSENDDYLKYDLSIPFGNRYNKAENFSFLFKILDKINNIVTNK